MLASFDHNGDLLLRVEKDDAGYLRAATAFATHVKKRGLLEASETDLLEEGFTGEITDSAGNRRKYVDGKQVPLKQEEPKKQRSKAKLDGVDVQLVARDSTNGLVKVKGPDGQEKVVRTDTLDLGQQGEEEQSDQEQEAAAYQFYSPNVKEDVKFDTALSNLGTSEQAQFIATSNDVLDQLGVKHSAENAVGDWKDGAENSVMQTIEGEIDRATLRYSASLIGDLAQQKAVLTFLHEAGGKDALYQMELPIPIAQARTILEEKGIAQRTLVPTKDGCKVVIFDQGDALLNKIVTVGDQFDATIQQTRGTGEFIGGEDREAARGEYGKAIADYEKEPDRPKYQAGGGDNRGRGDAGRESPKPVRAELKPPLAKEKSTPPPPSQKDAQLYEPDPSADTTGNGVADASRVGVPAHNVPPPPAIGRLPRLTKNERLVEARFADKYQQDPQAMVDAYVAKKNRQTGADKNGNPKYEIGDAPNIFNTDDVKMLSDVYNPPKEAGISDEDVLANRSRYNTVLHQAANAVAKKAFLQYLDQLPEENKTVLVTSGGVASGKGYSLSRVDAVNNVAKMAGAVWDAAGEQNATENTWIMEECEKRGIKPTFLYVHSNPNETWENPQRGVVERAGKIGRMVDARLFADSYTLGAKNFHAFHQANKDKAQFFVLDNTGKDPKAVDSVPKEALEMDPDALYERAIAYLQSAETVKPAVKRGGTNGLRIWPKKEKKDASESRYDPDKRAGRDLVEGVEPGFTGVIKDTLGREVHFVDGKRVKWRRNADGSWRVSEAKKTFHATLNSEPITLLAHDPKVNKVQVRLSSGEVVVVGVNEIDFDGRKEERPEESTPRPLHGSPRFSGEIQDSEGFRRFYVNGQRVNTEEEARRGAGAGGDDYELVIAAGPLTPAQMDERARLQQDMAAIHNVEPPTDLDADDLSEWRRITARLNEIVREFNSMTVEDRATRTPDSVGVRLNTELARLRGERLALGKSDLHGDEDEDGEDQEDEWDGEINDREVETGDYDSIDDWSTWGDWDYDRERYEERSHHVELAIGSFTPDGRDEPVEVYRWQSSDGEGDYDDSGEWTTDRDDAERDGRRYAQRNNESEPDPPEEDDSDGEFADEDVEALFNRGGDLGLDVEQNGSEITLRHEKIADCMRTLHDDSRGKYIHNDNLFLKDEYMGDGFGGEVFFAEVEGARAAGFDFIETYAARIDRQHRPMNGYYTWLTLGYNQSLKDLERQGGTGPALAQRIRELVPGATTMQDMMAAGPVTFTNEENAKIREKILYLASLREAQPKIKKMLEAKAAKEKYGLREWWLAVGIGLQKMVFKLNDGSRSMKILTEVQEKKNRKKAT